MLFFGEIFYGCRSSDIRDSEEEEEKDAKDDKGAVSGGSEKAKGEMKKLLMEDVVQQGDSTKEECCTDVCSRKLARNRRPSRKMKN